LFTGSSVESIDDAVPDQATSLTDTGSAAEYLIIAADELVEASESLADYRAADGLPSKVVKLSDVYTAFNYGIENPHAIGRLLTYAGEQWSQSPVYVVLVGDGSYDYRNYRNKNDNLVPPLMVSTPEGLAPSDMAYRTPGMVVGRLPVMTGEELEQIILKIQVYETTSQPDSIIIAADNPDKGGNFWASGDAIASTLESHSANKIYLTPSTVSSDHNALVDAINTGAGYFHYAGHGGVSRMASEGLLTTSQLGELSNINHPVILTAMSCLIGNFAVPGFDGLSEQLLLHQSGGSIAGWAATGLSFDHQSKKLAEEFYRALPDAERLGDALREALEACPDHYLQNIYNLLGDPALLVK